jgi:peptidoglycan/LPS O-acetylase OafA/YrhL
MIGTTSLFQVANGASMLQKDLPDFLKQKEYPCLNGLRGVSILCVIAAHVYRGHENAITDVLSGGWGVLMFFVISGFLITTLLFKERASTGTISLRNFYVRRALRILPVAYLFIAVMLLLGWFGVIEPDMRGALGAALYAKNIPPFDEGSWYFGHFWSLAVEEQYYFYVPFLLLYLSTSRFLVFCGALTVSAWALVYASFHGLGSVYFVKILGNVLCFQVSLAVGAATAILVATGRVRIPCMGAVATLGLALGSALCYSPYVPLPILFKPFVSSILLAVMLISCVQQKNGPVASFLNSRPIAFVGVLSYSLYVWQQAFTYELIIRLPNFPSAWNTCLNLLLLAVVALASYYLYERQFLRLKERFQSPRTAVTAPAPHDGSQEMELGVR